VRISIGILVVIFGIIVLGPLFITTDPLTTNPEIQLQPPDGQHPLGTDLLGRDVLSRVVHGGRQSLIVATLATLWSAGAGLIVGGVTGLSRYDFDLLVINATLAVPSLVIALVILTLLGRGTGPLVIALGFSQIAPFAFVTRSAVRLALAEGYVEAAYSLGASRFYVLTHHIFSRVLPTLVAYTGVVFSYTLLNGAALSFLGIGHEPGIPDWGTMLAEGRANFRTAPWIGLAPGVAITLIIWSVNEMADQLTSLKGRAPGLLARV